MIEWQELTEAELMNLWWDQMTRNAQPLVIYTEVPVARVFGRPYYRSRLCYSMSSVCLSVCRLSVTFCVLAKRLDRFEWNFQGRCGVTMGRRDYILGHFGKTARCRDTNFFVSNITRKRLILAKRLDRFAWTHHSFCIDRLLWGSMVGHPSNSWVSCMFWGSSPKGLQSWRHETRRSIDISESIHWLWTAEKGFCICREVWKRDTGHFYYRIFVSEFHVMVNSGTVWPATTGVTNMEQLLLPSGFQCSLSKRENMRFWGKISCTAVNHILTKLLTGAFSEPDISTEIFCGWALFGELPTLPKPTNHFRGISPHSPRHTLSASLSNCFGYAIAFNSSSESHFTHTRTTYTA